MNYESLSLSEVVEKVIDNRGLTPKKLGGDWSDAGYRVLSAKNIKNQSLVQEDKIRTIDDSLYSRWMDDDVHRGDIILTSEAPCGETLFWDSDEKIVLGQRLFGIRVKREYDPYYLFLYMNTRRFQNELSSRMTGTTVQGIRQSELMKCRLSLPSYDVQVAVTKQIKPIDDLIRLNNSINDYLSNIAEAVFTHFQITHKTSECHLSDIAYIVMGQSPPGESYNTEGRGIMFFQGRAEFGQFFPTPNLFTDQPKRLASKGDILISVRAPVGDINIAIADCCIGRGLAAVRSNSGCQAYIHHLIDSIRSNFDQYNGTGTVFGSINKNELNSLMIHIVDSETMKECNYILSEIDAAIKHMHDENELLIKIRMLLMSKFLSSA